jgi:DNA-directed RNA polymerase II subunit RPB2
MNREEYEKTLFESFLPTLFKNSNVVSNIQIDSFNYFLEHRLQKIIEEDCTLNVKIDKHEYIKIHFGQVYIDFPYIIDNKRNIKYITPHEARIRELTYSSCVSVDIQVDKYVNDKLIDTTSHSKVLIARLPIMIGCKKCNLTKKINRIDNAECQYDTFGYFIIKGKERVLITQERGNLNQVYVFKQKPIHKYSYVAELRSISEENGHSVLMQMRLYPDSYKINVNVSFFQQDIELAYLLKYYECDSNDVLRAFEPLVSQNTQIKLFVHTLIHNLSSLTYEDAVNYLCENLVHSMMKDVKEQYLEQIMTNDIFLNLGITSTNYQKKNFIFIMLKKLLMTATNIRSEDDRDHLNNKRFETAGYLVSELFRALYKRFLRLVEQQILKKQELLQVISRINIITQGIKSCFSTGNWGIPKSNYIRCGVSQILSRLSYNSTLSHLRRILIPIGKEGKNSKIRQIHNSQFGYICGSETPEGGSAGIVKSFSLFAKVTNRVDVCFLRNIFEQYFNDVYDVDSCDYDITDYHIFLNGIWIGITKTSKEFLDKFYKYRRNRMISWSVSISINHLENSINIFSDDGRIVRPVWNLVDYTVEDVYQFISSKPDWNLCCKTGMILYMDSQELEQHYISMYLDEVNEKHTLCEIHPSFIFGVCVNIIPYVDHIQAPRITYQSAMSKQAIGIFVSNNASRCDTVGHVLCSPEKPVVQTHLSELLNYDKLACGSNVIVAIACYGGYNQEDSIIFNKASLDRGLFRSFTYRTIIVDEKKRSSYSSELIELPELSIRNKLYNYDKLNKRGLVKIGVYVGVNDVLVGRTINNCKKSNIASKIDNSVIVRNGEEGYIDSIFESVNPDGYLTLKIKIRTLKIPEMGDKFACYHPDTDVLTDSGWKSITEVSVKDKVACLVGGNTLEYHHPIETQKYDFNGKMYLVQSKKVDLCVTPNHRMYVGSCNRKNYSIKRADEIYGNIKSYKNNVEHWKPTETTNIFTLQGVGDLPNLEIELEAWCVFMGIWFAEGSCSVRYYDDGRVHYRKVDISVNKDRVKKALETCMKKIDMKWKIHMSKGELVKWYTSDLRLIHYLHPLSVGAIYKKLPDWCFTLDQHHTRKFIEGMVLGDGCYMGGTTTIRYYTSSIQLRDDFQRLCLHAGYGCNYYLKSPKGTKSLCLGKEIQTNADYWTLTICKSQTNPIVNKYINEKGIQHDKWVDYDGPVYCCSVPTNDGIIFVRRNGKSIWSGNSRSAQKGVVGIILNEEDMPFTSEGIIPDIIINPHSQPSRMTINQLMECVAAKSAVIRGEYVYSTPFSTYSHNVVDKLCRDLKTCGYQEHGNEFMMNGMTGKPFHTEIFIGPTYYQRLKHLISNKIHARDHGPVQTLVRQPLEGRSKDGGLRFGEMERDCFVDTPIPQMCGLSFMLSSLNNNNNIVLGWAKHEKQDGILFSKQTNFIEKGNKECVEIIFEDGRSIKCTPDHRLLDSNGNWITSRDIKLGQSRLKASVTFPLVDLQTEVQSCQNWSLEVGSFKFYTHNTIELLKTFAFVRIIGMLITDGHIEKDYDNACVYLEHSIDVQVFESDFKLAFLGLNPKISKNINYTVRFPRNVVKSLLKLDLIRGNKSNQNTRLPSFITDIHCPLPIVREFLGGLFGGDGHTCILGMHRGKRDILTSISFSKSALEPYLPSVHTVLHEIKNMLNRLGIDKITFQTPKEISCSKKRTTDCIKTFSETIHLEMDELINFHKKIGFRYCIHKSLRLEAAVSYKNFKNNVIRQHDWLINKVDELTQFSIIKAQNPTAYVNTSKALLQAIKELKTIEPLYHNYAIPTRHDFTDNLIKKTQKSKFRSNKFPTPAVYMEEIDAYEWFIFKNPDGSHEKKNNKVCFGIKQYENMIPTMNLKVIDIRPIGLQKVYDIQVDKTESFLANGVVAHNCMISHGVSKFLNERLFDLSDKFEIPVCKKCGFMVNRMDECSLCQESNYDQVRMLPLPYACKLLFQELTAMGIKIAFNLEKN